MSHSGDDKRLYQARIPRLRGPRRLSLPSLPICLAGTAEKEHLALGNQLIWETRIFEDRRRVVKFVCEVPTAIDQRLFALGRAIQQEME